MGALLDVDVVFPGLRAILYLPEGPPLIALHRLIILLLSS
jgi:hypothetical protein